MQSFSAQIDKSLFERCGRKKQKEKKSLKKLALPFLESFNIF